MGKGSETTIGLSKDTKKALSKLGKKGDSFEDIIKLLIVERDS